MKYLKIEDNKAKVSIDGTNWKFVDEIDKSDLMLLIELAIQNEFEMDEFDADKIGNQAHQIIYSNLYEKLMDLNENKTRFSDEVNGLYKDAIEKYSTDEK